LLRRNAIDPTIAEWLPYPPSEAGQKLLSGDIQAALIVQSLASPVVHDLLVADGINLASFPRADAYVALYPYLNKLVLPAGVADLAKNRPPVDTVLLAPMASLVVRDNLHPAIQYLLLEAAQQVHSRPGIFAHASQFPSPNAVDLPVSENALQYYKSGLPFLQRYLPFWLAVLVGRLLVLLIPVAGVLYPVLRLTPALYGWAMRRRIFSLYAQLKAIENDLYRPRGAPQGSPRLIERLDRLEHRVNRLRVPTAYASMVYTLRSHIDLVRASLAAGMQVRVAGEQQG